MTSCLIMPTYWSVPSASTQSVFDHPTEIDGPETLSRTLANLEENEYPDPVVVFPVPSDRVVEDRVRHIAAGRKIDLRVFTRSDFAEALSDLEAAGFPTEFMRSIALDTYGGVRNIGLLYAALHGFENLVMIDDDECIDREYRSCALADMGRSFRGRKVLGKTGCVVDKEGKKYYEGQAGTESPDWPKDSLFNENVKRSLEATSRLSACEVAFGGNMVLNRELFLQVPFDPYGSRGEDDDYVLNARYAGMPLFFDQSLVLLHLPPDRHGGFWKRQGQDIIRFKYAREKARVYGFSPDSLGPFFEYFTREDLELKAVSSSIYAATRFLDKDRDEALGFMSNAVMTERLRAQELRARVGTFLRFMAAWKATLPRLWGKRQ